MHVGRKCNAGVLVLLLWSPVSQLRSFMQEASRPSDVRIEAQAQCGLDAASTAQFVSHLEDDPLIQEMEAAGGLPMRDQDTENLTAGLRACAASHRSAASYQLPFMTREMHSKIMSILWANLEVRLAACSCARVCMCTQKGVCL